MKKLYSYCYQDRGGRVEGLFFAKEKEVKRCNLLALS